MFIIDGGLGFENLQKNNPEITIVMEKTLGDGGDSAGRV